MKKYLPFLACALLFTSCGSSGEQPTETTTTAAPTTTVTTTTSATTTTLPTTTAEEEEPEPYEPTFRNAVWGMTKAEVLKSEDLTVLYNDPDIISYEPTKISSLEALTTYYFKDGAFYRGAYLFQDIHTNDNLYIEDYEKVKNALTEKYGEPFADRAIWSDSHYKNDKENWGLALSMGDVWFAAQWETEDTDILLYLKGDNFQISHILSYTDKDYEAPSTNTTGL